MRVHELFLFWAAVFAVFTVVAAMDARTVWVALLGGVFTILYVALALVFYDRGPHR